jgi:hypothetical protein
MSFRHSSSFIVVLPRSPMAQLSCNGILVTCSSRSSTSFWLGGGPSPAGCLRPGNSLSLVCCLCARLVHRFSRTRGSVAGKSGTDWR